MKTKKLKKKLKKLNLEKLQVTNLIAIRGGGDERSGNPHCPPKEGD
ncbi:hypothetical protein [Aquimarina algiphila]|nr:hypothetical protein [Aquimarina algiphila]